MTKHFDTKVIELLSLFLMLTMCVFANP